MNATEVYVWLCDACGQWYTEYENALSCCNPGPHQSTMFECENCEEMYFGADEAEACCADSKDADPMTGETL